MEYIAPKMSTITRSDKQKKFRKFHRKYRAKKSFLVNMIAI